MSFKAESCLSSAMICHSLYAAEIQLINISDNSCQPLEVVQSAFVGMEEKTQSYWAGWLEKEENGWWPTAYVVQSMSDIPQKKRENVLSHLEKMMKHVSPPECEKDYFAIAQMMEVLNQVPCRYIERVTNLTLALVRQVQFLDWNHVSDLMERLCSPIRHAQKQPGSHLTDSVFDAAEKILTVIPGYRSEVSTKDLPRLLQAILDTPMNDRSGMIVDCLNMMYYHESEFRRGELYRFIHLLRGVWSHDRGEIVRKIIDLTKGSGMHRKAVIKILIQASEESRKSKMEALFEDPDFVEEVKQQEGRQRNPAYRIWDSLFGHVA